MALCIPTLVGPVSELTKSIRVQGALPGATIIVNSVGTNARVVTKGTASGGDDRVPLVSGPLKADDILVVSQEFSGESSGNTPKSMGMPVQKIPTALGYVGFVSHLYKCGEYLWINGGFPGATVEVRDNTNTVIGSSESNEGDVRMTLSAALSGNVTTHQLIPAVTGPDHHGYPDQINRRPLPSPHIQDPLVECQTRILITDVYDGAKVTIQKNDGTEQWAGFDLSSLWFPLSKPLKVGESLKVKQNMYLRCEQFSDFSSPYPVQKAADAPPPIVQTPICAGSHLVRVSNLVPFSVVTLTINAKTYKAMPPKSVYDFMVDKLDAGIVKATMELCGVNKDSATVQIDPTGNQQTVKLLEPLYSCARAVSITNITPGTALQVWKADGSQKTAISSIYHIFSQEATIPVTPYLLEGDKIWVKQWSCSNVAISSNTGVVVAHPTVSNPAIMEPVHGNTPSIAIKNAVAGALVEAYFLRHQTPGWVFCGSAIGKPGVTTLSLNTVLNEGDQLKVRQLFCSADERLSQFTNPPVTVVAPIWAPVISSDDVVAIHAILVPTANGDGEILMVGGDNHSYAGNNPGPPVHHDYNHSRRFNCRSKTMIVPPVATPDFDLFCCGHAFLGDGRPLLAGGTAEFPKDAAGPHHEHHFDGHRHSAIYNYLSATLSQAADMNHAPGLTTGGGRWYPTLCTLGNGDVFIFQGHPKGDDSRHGNNTPERYRLALGNWILLPAIGNVASEPILYPRLHVLNDGKIFVSSLINGFSQNIKINAFDGTTQNVSPLPNGDYHGFNCPSVMLALSSSDGYAAKILLCGGATSQIINLSSSSPNWTTVVRDGNPTGVPRIHSCATLLPTGQVVLTGGALFFPDLPGPQADPRNDQVGTNNPEIYDPVANHWTTFATPASVLRNYHSSALLMPDGNIWTAGGNSPDQPGLPPTNNQKKIEIYTPPYPAGTRPIINSCPPTASVNKTIQVGTNNGSIISKVVLMRCGSSTHAFNPDQRAIYLDFTTSGNTLNAFIPPNPNVVIPGPYMLFTVDSVGRPCQYAKFIRLLP